MNLHQFQIDAIEKVKELLVSNQRVVLVSPTGSGKTVMAISMIRDFVLAGERVLFIVHRRELVRQCSNRLGIPHGVIMSGVKESRGMPVQVCSVQTLYRRNLPDATVIFIDEAHHAVSASYLDLLLVHYKDAKVIGLTATPVRLDGRGLDNVFQGIVNAASIQQLIAGGFLAKPVVCGFPFEKPKAKVISGEYDASELEAQYCTTKIIGSYVENWNQYAKGRRSVAYTASVAHADKVASAFNAAGIPSASVNYNTKQSDRSKALESLDRGEIKVITNCALFTEGIDIPNISCVMLTVPTLSLTKYLQMVGRALRVATDKADAVILDHAGNYIMHGLPEDNRYWELEGGVVRQCYSCDTWFSKGKKFFLVSNGEKSIMACPECLSAKCECGNRVQGFLVDSDALVVLYEINCLVCGNKYSSEQPIPEEVVEGERGKLDTVKGMLEVISIDRSAYSEDVYAGFNTDFKEYMQRAKMIRARRSFVKQRLIQKYGKSVALDLMPRKPKEWWDGYAK